MFRISFFVNRCSSFERQKHYFSRLCATRCGSRCSCCFPNWSDPIRFIICCSKWVHKRSSHVIWLAVCKCSPFSWLNLRFAQPITQTPCTCWYTFCHFHWMILARDWFVSLAASSRDLCSVHSMGSRRVDLAIKETNLRLSKVVVGNISTYRFHTKFEIVAKRMFEWAECYTMRYVSLSPNMALHFNYSLTDTQSPFENRQHTKQKRSYHNYIRCAWIISLKKEFSTVEHYVYDTAADDDDEQIPNFIVMTERPGQTILFTPSRVMPFKTTGHTHIFMILNRRTHTLRYGFPNWTHFPTHHFASINLLIHNLKHILSIKMICSKRK